MSEVIPYVRRVEVVHNRVAPEPFDIDLSPGAGQAFSHLILTGRNGAGKSSTLDAIEWALVGAPIPSELRAHLDGRLSLEAVLGQAPAWRPAADAPWANVLVDLGAAGGAGEVFQTGSRAERNLSGRASRLHLEKLLRRTMLYATLRPGQSRAIAEVRGPQAVHWPSMLAEPTLFPQVVQHLVNLRFQLSLAREDRDTAAVKRLQAWFDDAERAFAELFDLPGLGLTLIREQMRYVFLRPSGEQLRFDQLPDGFSAVLRLWAELALRDLALRSLHPGAPAAGIVLIDELEAHLHLSLQERVLPFFTRAFPEVQFIVATHSPAVISSIPNAVVYDLTSHQAYRSADLQGIRYGTLMTAHFGLPADLDRDSTQKLTRLGQLAREPRRTPEQERELEALAAELSDRSSSLALEVWTELHHKQTLEQRGIAT